MRKDANGAGDARRGFVGENLDEVTKFNVEYAAARSRFVAASAGGVTPKVTSNRAVELAAGERGTTNELGRFLQGQIDARGARKRAEKASRVAEEEARNREAERSLALEKVAVAQSKKQSAEALRAEWDAQTSAKKEQKKSGRPPVRLVKFDALK
jgi:3-hydroxyisobutyrate dehydrogenase-like beta-hydroxyacid dehydrogenase